MTVTASGSAQVPVTGYQVVLAPVGAPVTLMHPQADSLVVAEPDQLALWCAGTEMLTTLTVQIHDTALAPAPLSPSGLAALTDEGHVEELLWTLRHGGPLLAYADDYGATALDALEVPAGTWRVRVTVTGRAAAAALDEQLTSADEADFDDPGDHPPSGPVTGPEVWLLELSPEP